MQMKRIIILLVATLAATSVFCKATDYNIGTPDFSKLEKAKHPRLLETDKEFKEYTKIVNRMQNKPLLVMHNSIMKAAEEYVKKPVEFVHKRGKSGRAVGRQQVDAEKRLLSYAYAYRYTKDISFVLAAEKEIESICKYEDWFPDHFLCTSGFGLAFAFAYDWMYKALDPKVKAHMEETIKRNLFTPGRDPKFQKWRNMTNNHNEVDNAGLVCAAIAFYEKFPSDARYFISDALVTNPPCLHEMYSPEGGYPEGPGYWRYGTQHEILLLTVLQKSLGTTFGLEDPSVSGWNNTGTYALYMEGNTGKWFNFYDCNARAARFPELWYFAWKTRDYSIVFREINYLNKNDRGYRSNVLGMIFNFFAVDYDGSPATSPSGKVYHCGGNVPVCIARTGWEKNDLFLGIKGGRANFTHGHMDAGCFVFDAYGVRWAAEIDHKAYAVDEVGLKKLNASLWNRNQGQVRWRIMSNDNHFHNTLTINDKEQVFNGFSVMEEVFENPESMGARVDMSAAFFDLERATRTALIKEGKYLEVTEQLRAETDSDVRWTLMTEATPEVTESGIILVKDGKKMCLKAEGAEVCYTSWPTDPKAYPGNPVADFDEAPKGIACCGFTFKAPAKQDIEIVVTIKPVE